MPSFGQLTQSSIEHSVSNKPFESIASELTKLRFNPFRKKAIKFPFEMTFQNFGAIDSLEIQFNHIEGENGNAFELHFNPLSFNIGHYTTASSEVYMESSIEPNLMVLEYQLEIRNENTDSVFPYHYQVIFDGDDQTVSYNYANDPDLFHTEGERFYVGLSLENDTEGNWFYNLFGPPDNPSASNTLETFDLLDSLPQKNTLYTFSNIATSVGEQSILDQSRLEKTKNGYRVFTTLQNVTVELINLNGQVLSQANNFGSNYYFISPEIELSSGVYLIKVSQANGKFATYKAIF